MIWLCQRVLRISHRAGDMFEHVSGKSDDEKSLRVARCSAYSA
jgi:hypothetical protein